MKRSHFNACFSVLTLLLLGMAFGSVAHGQTWEQTYGDDDALSTAYAIQQTADQGFIFGGDTAYDGRQQCYLVKIDPQGKLQWSSILGDIDSTQICYALDLTSDGGYVLAGYKNTADKNNEIYLVKTDGQGREEWSKTYGGPDIDQGYAVEQTSDGGYIITGTSSSPGGILIKTDNSGNEQWRKLFSGYGRSVHQTTDGGYIVAGVASPGYDLDTVAMLLKTDALGHEEWKRIYRPLSSLETEGYSCQQTADGGYVVAGLSIDRTGGSAYLIKTDALGHEEWSRTYCGVLRSAWAHSVAQTADGGYILTGESYWKGGVSLGLFMIKTDAHGNQQWYKSFGAKDDDEQGQSVIQAADGSYVSAGDSVDWSGGWYAYVVHYDPD